MFPLNSSATLVISLLGAFCEYNPSQELLQFSFYEGGVHPDTNNTSFDVSFRRSRLSSSEHCYRLSFQHDTVLQFCHYVVFFPYHNYVVHALLFFSCFRPSYALAPLPKSLNTSA